MAKPKPKPKPTTSSAPLPSDTVKTDLTAPPAIGQTALPHERDESVGMTGGIADPVIRQAHRDLEHGIEDTSRSNEADRAYRKLKQ